MQVYQIQLALQTQRNLQRENEDAREKSAEKKSYSLKTCKRAKRTMNHQYINDEYNFRLMLMSKL